MILTFEAVVAEEPVEPVYECLQRALERVDFPCPRSGADEDVTVTLCVGDTNPVVQGTAPPLPAAE